MILVDDDASRRIVTGWGAPEATNPDAFVACVVRATGMKALRLPDGTSAIGSDMGDGTFLVFSDGEGGVPVSGRDSKEWRCGRLDASTGLGFRSTGVDTFHRALSMCLRLPSPVLDDGDVIDEVVDDADHAVTAREGRSGGPRP